MRIALVLCASLAIGAGAPRLSAQEDMGQFRATEAAFNERLDLTTRLQFQNVMVAAGFLNAVPSDRFSLRLFRALTRLQRDSGLPATGDLDRATIERAFGLAGPMFRLWNLRRLEHPARPYSLLIPTGMGLQPVPNANGLGFQDPDGKLSVRFNHLPGNSAAAVYADLLAKYERANVRVNFRQIKDGWFVLSTTSQAGTDGYIRYHDDAGGVTGFALFWNNQKGEVGGERIATLMSGALWARMTGQPFVDPPDARPEPQTVSREAPRAPRAPDLLPRPGLFDDLVPSPRVARAPDPPGPAATASAPASKPEPATVTTGTGFFVTATGHLVTNSHVVAGCSGTIVVQAVDKVIRKARILNQDRTNDLALLKVDYVPPKVATLRLSARLGEDVAAFGFPHANMFASSGNFTLGSITGTTGLLDDSRYFQMSAPVHSGNSGGPLLDERGLVVGVVTAKLNSRRFADASGDTPQNVNFALKGGTLATFLDSNAVSLPVAAPGAAKLDRPDIAEAARQMSGFVACD